MRLKRNAYDKRKNKISTNHIIFKYNIYFPKFYLLYSSDIVVNERDILGTQLIRRNDELALLYEKIKIQQSTLSKGEAQYKYVF